MNLRPLELTYLLEDSALSGGVRVVLAHADALIGRGHKVRIVSKGAPQEWRSTKAVWQTVSDFSEAEYRDDDFVVATFWTTVGSAVRLAGSRALHFCQGYEGTFSAYRSIASEIAAVYRLPVPKIVVSRHLVDTCRELGSSAHYVGQFVDATFYEPATRAPRPDGSLRVLLVGAWEIDFKGIDIGYEAIRIARSRGVPLELVRVSPWPAADGEPHREADEFHAGLVTSGMKGVIQSCDLFLGPSRHDEGFGLPAAEAMAMGLPTILARIPSFLSFAQPADYSLFFDEESSENAAAQLETFAGNRRLAADLAERGRDVVRQFHPDNAVVLLEETLFFLRESQLERTEELAPGSS